MHVNRRIEKSIHYIVLHNPLHSIANFCEIGIEFTTFHCIFHYNVIDFVVNIEYNIFIGGVESVERYLLDRKEKYIKRT